MHPIIKNDNIYKALRSLVLEVVPGAAEADPAAKKTGEAAIKELPPSMLGSSIKQHGGFAEQSVDILGKEKFKALKERAEKEGWAAAIKDKLFQFKTRDQGNYI